MGIGTSWKQLGRVRCLKCEEEWDCLTEEHYLEHRNGSIKECYTVRFAIVHEVV